ncbi:uncharacterized protein EV154DRAFT_477757 [Mucor mucedo]|uniref:uncharacterized protein n=1 Tax=Mucor mucedo TaxID=29922 RepID=UPI00221E75D7|nr:uncharacterized protein EV154DRAFT_477757 [Mucor mucedo]KAI7894979.1 hypothetical protein EV154DRAFT_477757 [Mucor mucedo]
MRDNVMRDNVMRDNVMRDNVMRDNVMRDNVMRDNVMRDNVMRDNVMRKKKYVNALRCKDCNVDFKTHSELNNHNYGTHVDKTKVFIGNDTIMEVSKVDGKFNCPECSSKLSTPTTFSAHLKKKHNGHCEAISNKTKRRSLEDNNNDNSTTISLKHRKLQSLNLNLDEIDSSRSPKALDKNTAILLASGTSLGSTREKENSIMLARIGNLEPISIVGGSGKTYHFLKSSDSISDVLTDQPSGSWTLPAADTTVIQNSSSSSVDSLLDHIINTSPLYNHLFDQKYVELTMEVTELINQDWTFFPQLRYVTSQIFAGAILVNKTSALLLNCIESYGRSKTVDAHHERRIGTAMNTSSFPKKQPNYGWINIITTHEDGATKLKIGTTVSNLLVTSSIRIDKNSITKNIVELGPTTRKVLAKDDSTTSIDVGNYFYQLRQLRSKFHCLSTYTLCRSSSTFAYDISYRPYTIWTLCDYDSSQQTDSQSQLLSQLFQTIATSVINNGILAQIKLDVLNDLCSKLKNGAIKYTIREFIDQQEKSFAVINNMKLNQLLTILADSMTTSIKNANAVVNSNFTTLQRK